MRKHLILTCFGYMALGIALAVQILGPKAGYGYYSLLISVPCQIFFLIVVFTSMQKLKNVLFPEPPNEISQP